MSSDCSIVTLVCPKRNGAGNEWRVKHLNSIHWDLSDHQDQNGNVDALLNKIREYFKDCEVFDTEEAAEAFEDKLDAELQQSGLPEYGPTTLTLTSNLWESRKNRSTPEQMKETLDLLVEADDASRDPS